MTVTQTDAGINAKQIERTFCTGSIMLNCLRVEPTGQINEQTNKFSIFI